MRKAILWLMMIWLVVSSIGCVVVVKEEKRRTEPVYCPSPDQTIAEIDAIAKLSFESNRRDAYQRIAARTPLSDAAQVHLVNEALRHLSFENSREGILITLIENESFSCEGKRAILSQLDKLSFENSRQRILETIGKREPCN